MSNIYIYNTRWLIVIPIVNGEIIPTAPNTETETVYKELFNLGSIYTFSDGIWSTKGLCIYIYISIICELYHYMYIYIYIYRER